MDSSEISDGVFVLRDALPLKDFIRVYDEFSGLHSPIMFTKVEAMAGVSQIRPDLPYGALFKPGDTLLGDNPTLLDISTRVSLLVQRLIRKRVELTRINTNVQFFGQETTFHTDGDHLHWTCVIFVCPSWHANWGGELLINSGPTGLIAVPYSPNSGAIFRADILHRGCAPNSLCTEPRNSVAFTFKEIP